MREADLSAPVKALLEARGFEVKAEIGPCDLLARRGDDVVAVELKLRLSLGLIHQAVDRQTMFENVYLAVPGPALRGHGPGRLCRRLGLGLISVGRDGAEALLDPDAPPPRRRRQRAEALLREWDRRAGDPNLGGIRGGRVTAYRQDALRCARHLAAHGPCKAAEVARAAGVPGAARLMRLNHYGWFERVSRGVYALAPAGAAGLDAGAEAFPPLAAGMAQPAETG